MRQKHDAIPSYSQETRSDLISLRNYFKVIAQSFQTNSAIISNELRSEIKFARIFAGFLSDTDSFLPLPKFQKTKVQAVSDKCLWEIISCRGLYRYSNKTYEEQSEEMTKTADRRIAPSCFERMPSLFTKTKTENVYEFVQIYGNQKEELVYRQFRKEHICSK